MRPYLFKSLRPVSLWASALLLVSQAQATPEMLSHPDYPRWQQQWTQQGISASELDALVGQAALKENVLRIMNTPGESKPWFLYRDQFVNDDKIQRGVVFAQRYRDDLQRAEDTYGVPKAVILGILGVETSYGANKGSFLALDVLATLAFYYPRRAEFFQQELGALMLYAREQRINPAEVRSSYAGAIGFPQFMPSSIRNYAVDFDGDGQIALRTSAVDAIGSIARYLAMKGWQKGQPVAIEAVYQGSDDQQVIAKDLTQPSTAKALADLGLRPATVAVPVQQPLNGIRLDNEQGPRYWLTYPNFQVITTYNRSRMYAMAVWMLGQQVSQQSGL